MPASAGGPAQMRLFWGVLEWTFPRKQNQLLPLTARVPLPPDKDMRSPRAEAISRAPITEPTHGKGPVTQQMNRETRQERSGP